MGTTPVKLMAAGDGGQVLPQYRASSGSFASDSMETAAAAGPKRGMILPFQPLTISFKDIKYFVDMPVVLDQTPTNFFVMMMASKLACCSKNLRVEFFSKADSESVGFTWCLS